MSDETKEKAKSPDFESLKDEGANRLGDTSDFSVLMDVPVTLSLEVGRTNISIKNLLNLTQGSVVELDRHAGEPLDVLVNGTLIAHAEVVVVNEKFGLRFTDVTSAQDKINNLKEVQKV